MNVNVKIKLNFFSNNELEISTYNVIICLRLILTVLFTCSGLFYCSVYLICSIVLFSSVILFSCSVQLFCSVVLEIKPTYQMNRICNGCNINIDENNYLKDRTVCKCCYNKNRREDNNNTSIQNQQTKIDKIKNNNDNNPNVSTYEKHDYVIFGPRNVD